MILLAKDIISMDCFLSNFRTVIPKTLLIVNRRFIFLYFSKKNTFRRTIILTVCLTTVFSSRRLIYKIKKFVL